MLIYFKTVILNASTQSKIPSFPTNWKIKKNIGCGEKKKAQFSPSILL